MKDRETFTNSIDLKPPFTLIIGRKKSVIKKPCLFVMVHEHPVLKSRELSEPIAIAPRPIRATAQMFIDGKLFATTMLTGTQRPSAHVRLLRDGNGKRKGVEIHLVKKYTTLAAMIVLLLALTACSKLKIIHTQSIGKVTNADCINGGWSTTDKTIIKTDDGFVVPIRWCQAVATGREAWLTYYHDEAWFEGDQCWLYTAGASYNCGVY